MTLQTLLICAVALCCSTCLVSAFRPSGARLGVRVNRAQDALHMGMGKEAKRSWAKGDLSENDIFDDDGGLDEKKNKKFMLEPESVFFEGPPSLSEVFLPALSVLTVIGIIPFISSLSRQVWVRYKFTSRRISIQSGIGGKETSEIIYPDIEEIRFVYRLGGAGDMVLFLKDGAKVEMRHVPKFDDVLDYILDKTDVECQEKSQKPKAREPKAEAE